jgi:hypothetical protein
VFNRRARFAQLRQLGLELLVRNLNRRLGHRHVLVPLDGKRRHKLEHRLHMQRRAVLHRQLGHLRLPHELHAQLGHSLVEPLRQQAVNHILADLGCITPLDHRFRHLAGAEAGNLGIFAVVAHHGEVGLCHFFRGNVQHQLTGALRI